MNTKTLYDEGYAAYFKDVNESPYPKDEPEYNHWQAGWITAYHAHQDQIAWFKSHFEDAPTLRCAE